MKFAKVEHQFIDIEDAMQMLTSIKGMIKIKGLKDDSITPLLMEMEPSAAGEFLKGLANILYEKKGTILLVSESSHLV